MDRPVIPAQAEIEYPPFRPPGSPVEPGMPSMSVRFNMTVSEADRLDVQAIERLKIARDEQLRRSADQILVVASPLLSR